eukprot:TRINITY_DN4864_c0_g1_i3.p1 TRINITY_DN4864_c0_g1~~TRINITY_DN4864_c0_g1_i3.p1  ORF type:complete len:508 (-),score=75.94 TRINITY_DN4864_c0_g1_i3:120-1643(-)
MTMTTMLKKSSSLRKQVAKQRKQTSLDCFIQQISKNPPEFNQLPPNPPALDLICLSQLSKASSRGDELIDCTPKCDTFSLGWNNNVEPKAEARVMPPTPHAAPRAARKSKLEAPAEDCTSMAQGATSPAASQDGLSQEMRPRKILGPPAVRPAQRGQGERCMEAALAKASVISPEPGVSTKPVVLPAKRKRESSGTRSQSLIESSACKVIRQGSLGNIKMGKTASSRSGKVARVGRNPFLPKATGTEHLRHQMVGREMRTTSRFRNEYEEVKTIARNGNCEVCQCRKRFDGALYAVKKVLIQTSSELPSAKMEIFALAALSHRNVLRYFDSWHESGSPGQLYLVTELCIRPLSRSLGLIPEPPMCERIVRGICHQLLQGLEHVHLARIAHLDLKPANIFISFVDPAFATEPNAEHLLPHGQVVLKIGDFGLATFLDQESPKEGSGGDGQYVCPALMNQRCKDLRQADVFSLAATIYAMAMGNALNSEALFRSAIREGRGYGLSLIHI